MMFFFDQMGLSIVKTSALLLLLKMLDGIRTWNIVDCTAGWLMHELWREGCQGAALGHWEGNPVPTSIINLVLGGNLTDGPLFNFYRINRSTPTNFFFHFSSFPHLLLYSSLKCHFARYTSISWVKYNVLLLSNNYLNHETSWTTLLKQMHRHKLIKIG